MMSARSPRLGLALAAILCAVAAGPLAISANAQAAPKPKPTATPKPTHTMKPKQTPTVTATAPPATATPTVVATSTPVATVTAVPTRTATPVATVTATVTPVPTATTTATATPVVTATPVATATATGPAATPTPGVGGCPTSLQFEANGDAADLDTGWSGQSHDNRVINNGALTLNVSGCTGASPSCGQCNVDGPIQNSGGTPSDNHRCTGDTSIECTTDADCGTKAPCAFFFGAPLPLSSGGVSVCVVNQVIGAVTGTANTDDGTSETIVDLISRVHTGITVSQPCSNCGTGGFGTTGTCSGGPRSGLPCTVNGTSPLFGNTSFDCPPDPAGNIGNLSIALDLTTGADSRTLTSANPNCTAPGFTS